MIEFQDPLAPFVSVFSQSHPQYHLLFEREPVGLSHLFICKPESQQKLDNHGGDLWCFLPSVGFWRTNKETQSIDDAICVLVTAPPHPHPPHRQNRGGGNNPLVEPQRKARWPDAGNAARSPSVLMSHPYDIKSDITTIWLLHEEHMKLFVAQKKEGLWLHNRMCTIQTRGSPWNWQKWLIAPFFSLNLPGTDFSCKRRRKQSAFKLHCPAGDSPQWFWGGMSSFAFELKAFTN